MPSFPQPGSVTICEINRDFITADNLSEDRAKETYGKILGTIFNPVPFQSESLLVEPTEEEAPERSDGGLLSATLQAALGGSLKHLLQPTNVKLLEDANIHALSWHPCKHILAFVSGAHQVTIRDYEDSECKDPCVLISDYQKNVKSLEWRPNGGKMLSIACKDGICIWAASYPGNSVSIRCGTTKGTMSRASGTRWTQVDFLRSQDDEQISALSWSPDGSDGTFYLWETNTWTSEPWSSTNGFVTGATWDPDGRMILVAFSESSTLGSLHFASKPPSLDAHLVPVELPEIQSLTGSRGIEKIAWDSSGERLAVSYKDGDELYKGLIAIYDVKRSPLVSASLIGFIRGPGDNPKPIAFSFHERFKQGPLLSVCWSSGSCCTYPFIFRSHVLP